MKKKAINGVLISASFLICNVSIAENYLTGDQISELFSGKTTTFVSLKKKPMAPKWVPPYGNSYYAPAGNLSGTITFPQKSKKRAGTWKVTDDKLCVNWKKEKCWNVEQGGDGSYYLINPKNEKKAIKIKELSEGNQL